MKKTEPLEIEMRTELGFRDITEKLKEGFVDIEKYDVVKGILAEFEKVQTHEGGGTSLIYYFHELDYNMKGRIFPIDERVRLNRRYDIIIHNWKDEINPLNVDAQIYHDFYEREIFTVRISRITEQGDPSFKLFNYITGFVKNSEGNKKLCDYIKVGSIVAVELDCLTESKDFGRINALVEPLEILSV